MATQTADTGTTTSREANGGRVAPVGFPPELIIFGLAMISVLALVVAPHRIGPGF